MQVEIEKLPKTTYTLSIKVPSAEVKKAYDEVLNEVVKDAELPGFRKGFAPRELVKEKTDVSKLYGEVVNELLQKFYPQALKEKAILPISNPRVEIKEFDIEKDFEFVATVAAKPEITIEDFRPELKKAYEEKTAKLKEENAAKLEKGEKVEHDHAHITPNEIIETILKFTKVEVPDLLIEEETERLVERLSQQIKAVGLTLDQYLKTQKKTEEDLRKDYTSVAEKSVKAEFAMGELVKKENIEISDAEIEEMAKASGDPDYQKRLQNPTEKWYIKYILQKNTLLGNLIEEVEGKDAHHAE